MLTPRFIVSMFSVCMMVSSIGMVSGQDYPNKPVRMVTSAAGGGADLMARLIAQGLTVGLGQQVVVENRGGVATIAAQVVAKAPPDGYTLLFYGSSFWLLPFLENTPYDPVRDFSPITWAVSLPNVLVVHPSLPVKSVKELIALAKARPGVLNYSSGTTGSATQLASELFKVMADINVVAIPFKGAGPALYSLLAGEVEFRFATPSTVMSHVKLGRLRALAVTSAQPSALVPGLPTVAASGLPGYESVSINAMFAPAATPAAVINRLNQETVRFLKRADTREQLLAIGVDVVANSPEEFAAAMKADMAKMGKLIKDAALRAN